MPYIVKRSDGAVWSQRPDHPGYYWHKDRAPATYTEREAKQVRLRVKNFHVASDQTVTVEKINDAG